jgi:hypothetical protein
MNADEQSEVEKILCFAGMIAYDVEPRETKRGNASGQEERTWNPGKQSVLSSVIVRYQ